MAPARRKSWLRRLGLFALSIVVCVLVVRLVGAIDWAAVRTAMSLLTWWQPLVLLAVVLVRQVLGALPLALYIPGVSAFQATLNDLGAILMSMVAPPPSDLALRVAMFTSWGVTAAKVLAGTLMNTLTFYVVRFATPIVGFVLLLVLGRPPRLQRGAGPDAGHAGRTSGPSRATHRRPRSVAQACLDFRSDISATFRRGFARSVFAYVGMLAADLLVLFLCLRFVGVDPQEASLADIAIAYAFAYPFTLFRCPAWASWTRSSWPRWCPRGTPRSRRRWSPV